MLDWSNKSGYQLENSITSIGSSGIFGHGFNKTPLYFPESGTDFIFAVFAEEFGFIGCLMIIGLFLGFMQRGFLISSKCPDIFGRLLAAGITVSICLQAFINIAVTSSMMPATGVPMPFVSYGGTSLIVTMCMAGVLLNISKKRIRRLPNA